MASFDTVDHAWMLRFLEHRIGDRRILRLIRKWLTAGVVEHGHKTRASVGTPQGAVISPLLAKSRGLKRRSSGTSGRRRRRMEASLVSASRSGSPCGSGSTACCRIS